MIKSASSISRYDSVINVTLNEVSLKLLCGIKFTTFWGSVVLGTYMKLLVEKKFNLILNNLNS